MDKEQQITEIANLMADKMRKHFGFKYKNFAEDIYNAGYRKICKKLPVSIDDLLIEFDEMDYAPTNLCENPVKEAIEWKENLIYELDLILDEKAAIERRAVKEFAERVKNEVYPFLQAEMYNQKHFITGDSEIDKLFENQNVGILKAQDVLSKWFKVKIDELLKEYESD